MRRAALILGISLLAVTFHGLSQRDDTTVEEHTIRLSQIRHDEAEQLVKGLFPELHTSGSEDSLTIRGTQKDCHQAILLFEKIDLSSDPTTQFISLNHIAAHDVAERIQVLLAPLTAPETFQVIPDPRTNRVFLMGSPGLMEVVTRVIERLDRA